MASYHDDDPDLEPSRYFDLWKARNNEMPYVYTTDGLNYYDDSVGGFQRPPDAPPFVEDEPPGTPRKPPKKNPPPADKGKGGKSSNASASSKAPAPYVVPKVPNIPIPTYAPFLFQPLKTYAPNTGIRTSEEQLLQKMLDSPGMSDTVVSQMKEKQKGTLLDMQNQAQTEARGNAARRNAFGGLDTRLSDIQQDTIGAISGNYRDIDIAKVIQDRDDQEAALAAANAFNTQRLGEYLNLEDLNLKHQGMQADENYRGYGSEASKSTELFGRWLSEQGLRLGAQGQAFTQWLQNEGLLLELEKFSANKGQFDQQFSLMLAQFLAGGG